MIRYYKKIEKRLVELDTDEPNCWINISPPFSHEELEEIASIHEIPLDFLTDSLDIDERSRYEREDNVKLFVLNTPILNEVDKINNTIYATVPIGIILTPDRIVTITSFENPVLQRFLDNKIKNFDPLDDRHFVLQIFEQNVYRFLNCLKDLNLKRNLIEQELYDSSRNRELKQLLGIEKSLVYFVTALSSNELLKLKMKRADYIGISDNEEMKDLFDDIIIDNSQALEMANTYTNILGGTMDAFASIISNNLNMVIQRLTLVTIILMVPTLVASFFGMNIKHGLENSRITFYIIVVASIVISFFLAWFFRRKRMF